MKVGAMSKQFYHTYMTVNYWHVAYKNLSSVCVMLNLKDDTVDMNAVFIHSIFHPILGSKLWT